MKACIDQLVLSYRSVLLLQNNLDLNDFVQVNPRERELLETLRVAGRGGGRATHKKAKDGMDDVASGEENHGPAAPFEGEEEKLLRAVDNGELDL